MACGPGRSVFPEIRDWAVATASRQQGACRPGQSFPSTRAFAEREGLDLRTVLGDAREHRAARRQIAVGFAITGFAEAPHHSDATAGWLSGYFATKAVQA
ncbi:hypothetical protein NGM36_18075 [Streptomyces mutabilis]|uniref:hypothetical protein n=1 Tax=Streptomyces mutabilis TaxID=67332 RepID=UPI0022BA5DF3|nr:hypothetical protein [Streptomyces mutabilis]MCZ9351667.1 hypothetical protein [Streptomyces mutabilis]